MRADTWEDIELFGEAKHEWLKQFLELPNGIPSHDTFGGVFSIMSPVEFQRSFLNRTQSNQWVNIKEKWLRLMVKHPVVHMTIVVGKALFIW